MRIIGKFLLILLFVGAAAVLAWKIRERFQEDGAPSGPRETARAAPVEVAPVTRGPIELRRVSSFEWKSSPYRLDSVPEPDEVYTGLDYLAAYWLLAAHDAARDGGAR